MPINKELKEERRAQGMCVYCGRPAVIKRDGKPARRCELCSGEQDMFAEQEAEADEATVDVKAIPQDCHRPLQLRDPMCNDCANRDTSACDHCDGCDKWEPTVK